MMRTVVAIGNQVDVVLQFSTVPSTQPWNPVAQGTVHGGVKKGLEYIGQGNSDEHDANQGEHDCHVLQKTKATPKLRGRAVPPWTATPRLAPITHLLVDRRNVVASTRNQHGRSFLKTCGIELFRISRQVEEHSHAPGVNGCALCPERRIQRCLLLGCMLSVIALSTSLAFAQESLSPAPPASTLPDAPQSAHATSSTSAIKTAEAGTATISGTVMDKDRDVLQGALLTLLDASGSAVRKMQSGNNGQFAFTGLSPGIFQLTVSAPGMETFNSAKIPLQAGEVRILPPLTLAISPVSTSVTVTGNSDQLAEAQVRIAEQQRIGGVIPNFYSSYDWNAPPMHAKQKFQLGIRSILDPVSFLTVAGIAGAEQYKNVFPEYGGGIEGYGKRYAAALANHAAGTLLGRAAYPALFHQDPRYFYKGKGSVTSRALYAVAAAVIARGDDGGWKPNYSEVLGSFSAAAISNLYYPAANRGPSLVLFNGLADIGGDAVGNLVREFVLKRITSHAGK